MKDLIARLLPAILILLTVSAPKLRAQENGYKTFNGMWQLIRISTNGSGERTVGGGPLKFFNQDGTFFNVFMTDKGPVMSHRGNYVINDLETYSETIINENKDAPYALAGKTYTLTYSFSEDKKLLTISGFVEGKDGRPGLTFREVWKRVEHGAPEGPPV